MGTVLADGTRSFTVRNRSAGKVSAKTASACELPAQPPRRLGVDTVQASAATVAFNEVSLGETLSATQPESLPERPTTDAPLDSFLASAEHQWPRTGVPQSIHVRGIASITPLSMSSILTSAYSEEATGTHLSPLDADPGYDPEDIPRILEPVLRNLCAVVSGVRLLLGCTERPKGDHGGSGRV